MGALLRIARRGKALSSLAQRGARAGALVGLLWTQHAGGQCSYSVTIIQGPTLPGFGPPATVARGLNNLGHIVGYYDYIGGDEKAFVWKPETGLVALTFPAGNSPSIAYDINDSGQIVGSYDAQGDGLGVVGFLRDAQNFTNLGTLPGGTFSEALSINDQGQIVGDWGNQVVGDPAHQGFLWEGGQMINLAPDLGTPNGVAHAISNSGKIVGWFGTSLYLDAHAFILENNNVTDLGVIPGGYAAQALAINDFDDVAGRGYLPDPNCPVAWHAFVSSNQVKLDLGTLPGHRRSRATGINNAGQVVGIFDGYPGCSTLGAFLWQNGVMWDLNELICHDPKSPISYPVVWAINESGQIAGYAQSLGSAVAVLLTPIDPPAGDLNHDCHVGIVDFLTLLAAWGPCNSDCLGDIDGDGTVGIIDFLTLLANWS